MGQHRPCRGTPTGLPHLSGLPSKPPTRLRPRPWTHAAARASRPVSVPVCPQCRAWWSCCFCAASVEAMRVGLRRLAEDHVGHDHCPGCDRIIAAGSDPDTMRRGLRRLAEIHSGCDPRTCLDRQRLIAVQRGAP